jgi:hypothetical protein
VRIAPHEGEDELKRQGHALAAKLGLLPDRYFLISQTAGT